MELTSVYWIPIFELLDARGFTVFLVNARDAKHVPWRKTDVSDAQWLQRLHSYGLLRASFRPKGQIAELRAYVRQRERLLEYAASHIQHMQKALTEMNFSSTTSSPTSPARPACGLSARSLPASATLRCWRVCAITVATPVLRRSRKHSPELSHRASVCARAGPRPSTTLTTRRPQPATAFYRRLSSRIGKAKAVTATARKVAVLFYNAVRHGMEYVDPEPRLTRHATARE